MAKLMLVEDDNNLREIYEARLQAEGYTIITAKDGEEALVVAKAEKPDLIIADVMMPKISGFEMLDILRNTESLKTVKVIMLTALGQADDQQRGGKLGADRYLVKSQVTLEDIVKVTHDLLDDTAAAAAAPAPQATDTPQAADVSTSSPAVQPSAPPPAVEPSASTPATSIPVVATPPAEPATPPPAPATPPSEPATPPVSNNPSATPTDASTVKDTAVKADAQSTSQEEASVEAKIEDFVAGATTEAPPPSESEPLSSDTAATPVETTTDSVEAETSTTPETTETAASSDDKLMVQAVNSLNDAAPGTPSTAPPPPEPKPAPANTATIVTPTEVAPPKPAAVDEKPSTGSVTVAHKKVITPLDSGPKTDLEELLAVEAANEARAAESLPPMPVVSTKDSPPPKPEDAPKLGAVTPATSVIKPAVDPEDAPAGGAPSATSPSANDLNDPNSIAL